MTTLLIGGNSGISQEIAKQLTAQGHTIHTACRNPTDYNHQTYDALNPTDLDLPETIDNLIYCPGSITLKPFHRLTEQDFLDEFKLNALGAATTIQKAPVALHDAPAATPDPSHKPAAPPQKQPSAPPLTPDVPQTTDADKPNKFPSTIIDPITTPATTSINLSNPHPLTVPKYQLTVNITQTS